MLPSSPVVVCLCGSTRFEQAYKDAMRNETLAGKIVLSVGLLGHQEGIDMSGPIKKMLDELHLRKIDKADEILVLNCPAQKCHNCGTVWQSNLKPGMSMRVLTCSCGYCLENIPVLPYIGESTAREIEYARVHGKSIRYLYPQGE